MDIEQTLKGLGLSERTIEAFLESPECIEIVSNYIETTDEVDVKDIAEIIENKCLEYSIILDSTALLFLSVEEENSYYKKRELSSRCLNYLMTDIYGYRDGHEAIYNAFCDKIKNYDWSKLDEQRN